MITGKIHSIETFGTLDGPGIRTVVFMQGCPNKCQFCHNPDAAINKGGKEYTVDKLVEILVKNKEYWIDYGPVNTEVKGGITFSGGDPIAQPEFLLEVIERLHAENIHVVVDTSLNCDSEVVQKLAPHVDLWMISIKQMFNAIHEQLIGMSNVPILKNILLLDEMLTKVNKDNPDKRKKQVRIRFVVIPKITDSVGHLNALGKYIAQIKNLETVELLAYSTIGRDKWIELFGEYHLEGIPEATQEDVLKTKEILSTYVTKFLHA